MIKKILSVTICVIMVLCMALPAVQADTDSKTVIVHYNRPDKDYNGWNLWMWPDGKDGKAIQFTDDDSFGKVALFSFTDDVSKVGIIVRLNDWESKDIEDDRFITVAGDVTEVWLNSGKAEILTDIPEGAEKYDYKAALAQRSEIRVNENETKLNVHYHRYNADEYKAGWNIWLWEADKDGAAYEFTSEDEFGAVATIGVAESAEKAGIIIRLNEWAEKDIDADRYIDMTQAKNGVLDIYLVENDENIYYSREDVDLSPKFLSAYFTDTKTIYFCVTEKIDPDADSAASYKVTDSDGKSYKIKKVELNGGTSPKEGTVYIDESVDFGKSYTLEREGFSATPVSLSSVFSTSEFESAFTYDGEDQGLGSYGGKGSA